MGGTEALVQWRSKYFSKTTCTVDTPPYTVAQVKGDDTTQYTVEPLHSRLRLSLGSTKLSDLGELEGDLGVVPGLPDCMDCSQTARILAAACPDDFWVSDLSYTVTPLHHALLAALNCCTGVTLCGLCNMNQMWRVTYVGCVTCTRREKLTESSHRHVLLVCHRR